MGVADGAINIAGVEARSDERQQSPKGILILIESIVGRPENSQVYNHGDQSIFVTIAVELSGAGYD